MCMHAPRPHIHAPYPALQNVGTVSGAHGPPGPAAAAALAHVAEHLQPFQVGAADGEGAQAHRQFLAGVGEVHDAPRPRRRPRRDSARASFVRTQLPKRFRFRSAATANRSPSWRRAPSRWPLADERREAGVEKRQRQITAEAEWSDLR